MSASFQATAPPEPRPSSAWSALQHRDFRLLWIATFLSNAGSWMQKVATSWLVYRLTGSELWLGIDAFASGFTTVVLLPIGGVISDRFDRRRLLIWTNAICAVLALALALLVWGNVLRVWHIVLTSALSGIVQSVLVPASTSLLPALVGEADVSNAISLNSLQFNLSRVVGPVVGGASLIYLGAGWSFALNALSFIVLSAAFIFIRSVPSVPHSKLPVATSLVDGVRFVRRRRHLLAMLVLVALTALLGSPVVSLLPALVTRGLGRDASSYSLLLSCFGAGAVIAAVVTASLGERSLRGWWVTLTLALVGATQVALAWCAWQTAIVLVAVAGFGFVGVMIRLGTALLQSTPDAYRGRVTSLQQICFRAGQPLGALIAGAVGQQWGIRAAFVAFGTVLVVIALTLGRPRGISAAIAGSPGSPDSPGSPGSAGSAGSP